MSAGIEVCLFILACELDFVPFAAIQLSSVMGRKVRGLRPGLVMPTELVRRGIWFGDEGLLFDESILMLNYLSVSEAREEHAIAREAAVLPYSVADGTLKVGSVLSNNVYAAKA